MTQAFDEQGRMVALTVVQAGPCPVVQVKDAQTDGYSAVKVGFGETVARRLSRAERGVFEKAGVAPHRTMREFRTDDPSSYSVGDAVDVGREHVPPGIAEHFVAGVVGDKPVDVGSLGHWASLCTLAHEGGRARSISMAPNTLGFCGPTVLAHLAICAIPSRSETGGAWPKVAFALL